MAPELYLDPPITVSDDLTSLLFVHSRMQWKLPGTWTHGDKSVANTEPREREISCDLLDGLLARELSNTMEVKFPGGLLDGLSASRSSRAQWKRNFVVSW
jgi:hypothetical protein